MTPPSCRSSLGWTLETLLLMYCTCKIAFRWSLFQSPQTRKQDIIPLSWDSHVVWGQQRCILRSYFCLISSLGQQLIHQRLEQEPVVLIDKSDNRLCIPCPEQAVQPDGCIQPSKSSTKHKNAWCTGLWGTCSATRACSCANMSPFTPES